MGTARELEGDALLEDPDVPATSSVRRSHRRLALAVPATAGLLAGAGLLAYVSSASSRVQAAQSDAGETVLLGEKKEECSGLNQNCNATKCCSVNGTRCYLKAGSWALCRPHCFPGPDPADMDRTPWKCKPLGERKEGHFKPPAFPPQTAPWVQSHCAADGENCTESRCCKEPGHVCYKKNHKWAACKAGCTKGPDPTDSNPHPWDCERLGMRTPGAPKWPSAPSPWVAKKCSKTGENCIDRGCCADSGLQCFKKNADSAGCLPGCLPGVHMDDKNDHPWNCTPLGARTPGLAKHPVLGPGEWVKEECSETAKENCHKTKCCKEAGRQCYAATEKFAACHQTCTSWKQWELNGKLTDKKTNKTWSCEKLGNRTPREYLSPSLFCFSVFRLYNAEADLMRNQLWKGIGIFACDNYAVFSSDTNADLGEGPLGPLKTVHFDAVQVGVSKDGTAANTALFMNVWEAVRWDGRYSTCDWTIKADPDAVVIPQRMRWKLKAHSGHPAFILNCGKAGMPDGPMMFGSVEAISVQALWAYFNSEATCRNLPWQSWGEDLWLGNCLKNLGVSAEPDYSLVSDGVCLYANCADKNAAAFHPFKDVHNWLACYWAAVR